jgi:hypothetical protein
MIAQESPEVRERRLETRIRVGFAFFFFVGVAAFISEIAFMSAIARGLMIVIEHLPIFIEIIIYALGVYFTAGIFVMLASGVVAPYLPLYHGSGIVRIRHKKNVHIMIVNVPQLIAVGRTRGRLALYRRLEQEVREAIDTALALPGDHGIYAVTDAFSRKRARQVGFREVPMSRVIKLMYCGFMKPTLTIVRRLTGSRGYAVQQWKLDPEAYREFRAREKS